MKEVISLKEVPFDFPLKKRFSKQEVVVEVLKDEHADYYSITSPNIYQVYSYNGSPKLLAEISIFDLYKALDANSIFKSKVKEYVNMEN
jgi:hypothetical protein